MNRQEKFIRLAYKYTHYSTHKFPMAAVLTQGHRVVSYGINQVKSHPKQRERKFNNKDGSFYLFGKNRPHAELDCLIKADYNMIDGGTLYVVRRKCNGDFGNAKPCIVCMRMLQEYGIREVFYSVDGSLIGGEPHIYERIKI